MKANAVQGPIHPALSTALDRRIQLQAANGAICTLSVSSDNDGPPVAIFRGIGDTGGCLARYGELFNGQAEQSDVNRVAAG